MKYTTYILQSKLSQKYYIGSTSNLERRLIAHNKGNTRSTKGRGPWEVVYIEEFPTKGETIKREIQIKRYKGGKAFKNLLKSPYSGVV